MVELDIKIKSGDLFDYMMRHQYYSANGIIANCLGAAAVVAGFMTQQWIFLILGVMLLLYLPFTLFSKSKQQAILNPTFQNPLHYILDETGITVSQGEVSEHQDWEQMVKAVSTARSIIVYTSKINATIFPRTQMGEKTNYVIEMISKHMPPEKVKIKY